MKKTVIVLIVVLLLAAGFLEWGVDRRSAQVNEEGGGEFNNAARVLDFLGGVRQYLAYSLFIKADKLHHTYFGNPQKESELIPYFLLISLLDSHYTGSYYIGSGLIADQGRIDEAIDYMNQGIDANKGSADLYFELADFFIRKDEYNEAKNALEESLEFQPNITSRSSILQALAACYRRLDVEKARAVMMELGIYCSISRYNPLSHDDLERMVDLVNFAFEGAAEG
ncbi:MAG: hypothetical protein A2W01_02165 [Candidatus Solincola sediminis]|nr:MAG: hypothetical protein A2W01_02165 [Candidatus Solincola sediminis]